MRHVFSLRQVFLSVSFIYSHVRGDWGTWTPCDRTCSGGTKRRICSNYDQPQCGFVSAQNQQTQPCNPQLCPSWSNWTPFSPCSEIQCGIGRQRRSRICQGVGFCPGLREELKPCGQACTPISYTDWGQWSPCIRSCGGGTRRRLRNCRPGNKCKPQEFNEEMVCNPAPCPRWSDWTNFTPCTRPCYSGDTRRSRTCQFGTPDKCPGLNQEERICNPGPCGSWNLWGSWSACVPVCGPGQQTRVRACSGGTNCPGTREERRGCTNRACSTPLIPKLPTRIVTPAPPKLGIFNPTVTSKPPISPSTPGGVLGGVLDFISKLNPTSSISGLLGRLTNRNSGQSPVNRNADLEKFAKELPLVLRNQFLKINRAQQIAMIRHIKL